MKYLLCMLLLLGSAFSLCAQTITECEWFIGSDPGPGNGLPVVVGAPDDSVDLVFSVTTGSLSDGLYRVNVRCRADDGRWGVPVQQFFVVSSGSAVAHVITEMDVAIDSGAPTTVDVADSAEAALNQVIATGSIPSGLHRYKIRCRDDLGRTGVFHDGFFVVQNNPAVARLITQLEYWFDDDAPTVLDAADAPQVSFNQILATAGLNIGLHRFKMRARDDLGRTGAVYDAFLIVSSTSAQNHTLTAAEYYVDVDPGVGSATPIPLPEDGVWDEGEEGVATVLTDIPTGSHLFAVRVRDDLGRWSAAYGEIVINMPLVIQAVGGQIVLSWIAEGGEPYHIYRADLSGGPFTEIDTTSAQTYTDTGILDVATKKFYRVTQTRADSSAILNRQTAIH